MGSPDAGRGADAVASIVAESPACADKIEVVQCDVTDDASVTDAAAAVKASLGGAPLYGLVNNAGAGLAHGVSAKTIVDVNLYGCKRVGDAFVPLLRCARAWSVYDYNTRPPRGRSHGIAPRPSSDR